jgi:hypothetical protein
MKTFIFTISCVLFFTLLKGKSDKFYSTNLACMEYGINDKLYTVKKLDSVNQFYLVYLERNDSVFKVLSKKEEVINCQPFQIGENYEFKLISWFKPEEIHLKLRMSGVKIENAYITIERDSVVGDLFTTENLKGLCYIDKR